MSNPQLEDGFIRIANELFKAIYTSDLNASELKIILFVIYQTYGYGKKKQYMTLRYIEQGTGIPHGTVARIIPSLIEKRFLTEKYFGKQKREIGLNKNYEKWGKGKNHSQKCESVLKNEFSEMRIEPFSEMRTNHSQKCELNTRKNNTRKSNTRQILFEKPSLFLCEEFAKSEGIKTDVETFYLYNEGRGWKGIEDWKAMLMLWAKNNPMKNENSNGTAIGSIKPWKECDGSEWQ